MILAATRSEKMKVKSVRFGEIEFNPQDVIRFPEGLPGFPQLKRFVILSGDEFKPFQYLQALDEPAISLLVLSPYLLARDYQLRLSPEDLKDIRADEGDDLLVYVVVTLPEAVEEATANMLAPIVINPKMMRGKQVVQVESNYSIKHPIFQGAETDSKF